MSHSWSGLSGTISVANLSEYLRHAAQDLQGLNQLCNPPTGEAIGRGAGDTVQYTYWPNISVTGGVLSENAEIPEGSLTPISGSYVVQEYGLATKWNGKLANLSQLPVEDAFVTALINDMRKVQNTAAFTEFNSTKWFATFNTANEFIKTGLWSDFTNVCTADLSLTNLRYVVKQARKNLIPYFDGENYVYVTGVDSADALRYDSAVSTMLQYDSGRSALNGEVGRLAQCRLVEDTHVIVKADNDGGASAATGAGVNLDVGFLVGGDAVVNEYALPPEVRAQDKDFGRSTAVAYYFIAAWKKLLGQTLHSKEHVIKVTAK